MYKQVQPMFKNWLYNKILFGFLSALFLFISGQVAHAQEESDEDIKDYYKLPSVGLGSGLLIFNGDVGKGSSVKGFTRFKPGYNFYIEKRFNGFFGLAANGLMGKLSANEIIGKRYNFESKIVQGDVLAVFHFDNGFILPKSNQTAPYFMAGFSYMNFNSYGDLKDNNGKNYNYWKDGSIRDLPEADSNRFVSKIIKRDYTYETQLKDSTTNYPRSTFSIPLIAGVAIKLNERIALCLQGSYYLTMSDYIDNVKSGGSDNYFYASAMLRYSLSGHHKDEDPLYKDVDYLALDNADTDGDKVKDGKDLCPGTPKGVKVDEVGCPLDTDNDGVPDYRDKEKNSKTINVDENGITLTDAIIEKTHSDTLSEQHSAVSALMSKKDAQIKSSKNSGSANKSKIPSAFAPADLNNDGIITSDEITKAIDAFFEGDSQFTVQKLNDLIDFFFEQ